jgi:hypothetical protein
LRSSADVGELNPRIQLYCCQSKSRLRKHPGFQIVRALLQNGFRSKRSQRVMPRIILVFRHCIYNHKMQCNGRPQRCGSRATGAVSVLSGVD